LDQWKRNHACGRPIDKRDGSGKTWLHKACASNDKGAFDWLLEQGANVNIPDNAGRTALHEAAKSGNAYMIQRLLDKGALHHAQTTGDKPIHNAVDFRNAHVLPLLAPFVNERGALGWTPLMIAAKYKRLECVEMLLRLGADVNMSTR
jgi:ankyrin repeat protein